MKNGKMHYQPVFSKELGQLFDANKETQKCTQNYALHMFKQFQKDQEAKWLVSDELVVATQAAAQIAYQIVFDLQEEEEKKEKTSQKKKEKKYR